MTNPENVMIIICSIAMITFTFIFLILMILTK